MKTTTESVANCAKKTLPETNLMDAACSYANYVQLQSYRMK